MLTWIDGTDPFGSVNFIVVLVVAAALWRRGRGGGPSPRRGCDDGAEGC